MKQQKQHTFRIVPEAVEALGFPRTNKKLDNHDRIMGWLISVIVCKEMPWQLQIGASYVTLSIAGWHSNQYKISYMGRWAKFTSPPIFVRTIEVLSRPKTRGPYHMNETTRLSKNQKIKLALTGKKRGPYKKKTVQYANKCD